jgi:hypothetical protein
VQTENRHCLRRDIMGKGESKEMARYFVETDIVWDKKRPQDTVNDNVSKLIFSAEKNKEFDLLGDYPYLPKMRDISGRWMFAMFGHDCPLYMCWVVRYDSTSNVGRLREEGSLLNHVDGSRDTNDLCAVVYTLHYGELKICFSKFV